MSALARLAGFAVVLAALTGGGAVAGGLLDPAAPGGDAAAADPMHGEGAMAPMAVRGLAIAQDGLRLAVADTRLPRGETRELRFRILDRAGRAVRAFDLEHTKRLHLIVARRDLTGFQHLHPRMAPDGTWSTPLRLDAPGAYRLFADFSRDGRPVTLAADLFVDGAARWRALPAPTSLARTDGYDVRLARAGRELRFAISRGGRPVRPEPYLGAHGHLVALRAGDLAFLHVHPSEDGGFETTFPTAGAYRLFLQFKHAGRVHTVAFTQEVR
ncbi:MAG TPA: hypothetical protein VH418_10040 [Solirubrobacteraceae bacterium]